MLAVLEPDVKNDFYNDLQASLNSMPKDGLLILVGDINARVGSTPKEDDSVWHGVRGYHGVGEMNESGENLLSFCAMNELIVMNALFEKANFLSTHGNILERNIGTVLITLLCDKVIGHCVKM